MRTNYHKWTHQELDYLANNYKNLTDTEMAKTMSNMLGVDITTAMIRRQRKKLSIAKPKGRRKKVLTQQSL
jgi:site-specific DNA-adenine methylase